MSGEIAIGSWLRQETLAAELGVSRTPLREAFRRLQELGIVELVHNRGALVRGPSPREISETYAVRAELEAMAAELAVLWITELQLENLRRAEERLRNSVEDFLHRRKATRVSLLEPSVAEIWAMANDEFHDVILDASNNISLQESVRHVMRRIPRSFGAGYLAWAAEQSQAKRLNTIVSGHLQIRKALEANDGELARHAMREHIRQAGQDIALWFDRRFGDAKSDGNIGPGELPTRDGR